MDALLQNNSCVGQTIDEIIKAGSPVNMIRALATLGLLMVRRGVFDVSGCHFSNCDIKARLDFI